MRRRIAEEVCSELARHQQRRPPRDGGGGGCDEALGRGGGAGVLVELRLVDC